MGVLEVFEDFEYFLEVLKALEIVKVFEVLKIWRTLWQGGGAITIINNN